MKGYCKLMYGDNTNTLLNLEKKLKCYENNYNSTKEYSFNETEFTDFINLLTNLSSLNIQEQLEIFNQTYFKDKENYFHLSLKDNSLIYPTNNINHIASELFNILYYKNKKDSFPLFVDYLRNKLLNDNGQEHWFSMTFKNDEIKDYFLDKATKYIIENKSNQEEFIQKINDINFENDYRFDNILHKTIPKKKFNNLFEMYKWFTIERGNEYIRKLGSKFMKSLLLEIIEKEETTLEYYKHNKRISKILEECTQDCIIMNEIFKSFMIDIKLNIYLLSNPKYTQFGLLNILRNNERINLQDNGFDYGKEWQELITRQTVNIYFQHYSNSYFEKESVFDIVNYLGYYAFLYENQNQYSIALDYFLIKLQTFHIQWYQKKEYFFYEIIETLVIKQSLLIESVDTLNLKDYFLMSWYLKELDRKKKILNENYSNLIKKIIDSIEISLPKYLLNSTKNNNFYNRDKFLEKVDFSLFYNLSNNQNRWLEILNIQEIKYLINKDNKFNILRIVKFYFKILLNIFKNNLKDKKLSKYLIELSITFGVKERNGIFYSHQNYTLLYNFLEILNYIDEDLFDIFLNIFIKETTVKEALQVYTYTLLETRKKKVYDKIEPLLEQEHSFFWFPDLDTTIHLASYHKLDNLVKKLIDTYQKYLSGESGKNKDNSGLKAVLCKQAIIKIYQNNSLSEDEKIERLNNLENSFDTRNYEEKHKAQNCKSYETFIRALIFYEDKTITSYNLLSSLFQSHNHELYLFNMLSAYFKAYIDDEYKIEKYKYILNLYNEDIENFIENSNLFNYQVLVYGYSEIGDNSKLIQLYDKVPTYHKEAIKQGLPKILKVFDTQAYIGNKLIICVEGKHDINFLKNINQNIEELKNIIDLETTNISFMDLKGGNLTTFVKENNLAGSNIIELHIYDSDKGSGKNENKYNKECEKVKNRDDKSFCFITNKREMENYIHPSLIKEEFDIEDILIIREWDIEDIPTFIKNKSSLKEDAIKSILNGKLSKKITKEHLKDLNAFDEIVTWFNKIKELYDTN